MTTQLAPHVRALVERLERELPNDAGFLSALESARERLGRLPETREIELDATREPLERPPARGILERAARVHDVWREVEPRAAVLFVERGGEGRLQSIAHCHRVLFRYAAAAQVQLGGGGRGRPRRVLRAATGGSRATTAPGWARSGPGGAPRACQRVSQGHSRPLWRNRV